MKKVLLLTQNFPPIEGGSGRWFWELYSRLPEKQVVICTDDVEDGYAFDETNDLHIIRVPMSSKEWGLKSITGLRFYWSTVKQVLKITKQYGIEEIHCGRVIHEGVTAWFVKILTGIPFRCFVHGEDIETASTSREQSLLVNQVCKNAKLLICNSYNSERLLKQWGFSNGNNTSVLHPGVDVAKFKPALKDYQLRKKLGWRDDSTVMLTVGRLQKRKGQDFLIKSMPKLIKTEPKLCYAIVGRGEELTALRDLIIRNNLQENVFIYEDLDDDALIMAYQQCDFFVLPNRTIESDIEGFGMVLVEAQACGKPVIAGDSGGTAETLIEGKTGFIIDCTSPDSIISVLPRVLEKCKKLSQTEILLHARNSFNWENHTKKFLSLLSKNV